MDDKDIPAALRRLIMTLQQYPADSPVGQVLANRLPPDDARATLAWLDRQARREALPLIFSFEVPGYVLLGSEDDARAVPNPGLVGLKAAWDIFLEGPSAPLVYFAADKGMTSNGLRNALARAAEWVDRRYPPLAVAIRGIKVQQDGSACFDMSLRLRLAGVFSACAKPASIW
ncbi:hypothetical protein [Magnetospirillum aberrantis]|uniref:Uncharacterized protein n=1 Tax=Magnetospirillum aberrantis SpK TaxID=908842 RepID=A0A7C9V1E2_9PROT|nr:hypothetical protein [Magnetospirillum aberrantis]NFV82113.1 hypothetical protein [Magnetospirillum aberrantis SpK]